MKHCNTLPRTSSGAEKERAVWPSAWKQPSLGNGQTLDEMTRNLPAVVALHFDGEGLAAFRLTANPTLVMQMGAELVYA